MGHGADEKFTAQHHEGVGLVADRESLRFDVFHSVDFHFMLLVLFLKECAGSALCVRNGLTCDVIKHWFYVSGTVMASFIFLRCIVRTSVLDREYCF